MDVANNIANEKMEIYGLCDKNLACTTCSVHIKNKFNELKPPTEEELDILYTLKDFRDKYIYINIFMIFFN